MNYLKAFSNFAALTLAIAPSGFREAYANGTTTKHLRSATLGIKREISSNLFLRADVIPENSEYEILILGGGSLSKEQARKLLHNDFYSLYSGTFYVENNSLGDIVGVHVKNPNQQITKPFPWGEQTRTGRSIAQRFCFGVSYDDTFEIVRRSEIKSTEKTGIASGAELTKKYKFLLGGLARVNLLDKEIMDSLIERDSARFIKLFNVDNRNFNGKSAYDGIDGRARRARNGIILGEDPNTGQKCAITMCIGNGNISDGTTVLGYAVQSVKLLKEFGLVPLSIALADGGSSVCSSRKNEGVQMSLTPTLTAIGVRVKSQASMNKQKI